MPDSLNAARAAAGAAAPAAEIGDHDAALAAYRGDRLALSHGPVHYRWDGPDDAPGLLLIHGATVPMWQFNAIAPLFNAAGLRTLRLDLYGHGRSAYPRVAYTPQLFVDQVGELLDALRITAPLYVLGHSMGAAVAARLAAARPRHLRAVVLVAPLLDYRAVSRNSRLLPPPLLGELLMHGYVLPMLTRRRYRRYSRFGAEPLAALFGEQRRRGQGRALLSMFRHGALADQRDAYRALAACGLPAQVLRGALDEVAPAAHVAEVCALLPRARAHTFDGLEHNLMLRAPRRVADAVQRFLLTV